MTTMTQKEFDSDSLMITLVSAKVMIAQEIDYVKTGWRHGPPMRDCVGQWSSLLRDIQREIEKRTP